MTPKQELPKDMLLTRQDKDSLFYNTPFHSTYLNNPDGYDDVIAEAAVAKVINKRLDNKELREKIIYIMAVRESSRCGTELCKQYKDCKACIADQILPLYPDIEGIRKQAEDDILKGNPETGWGRLLDLVHRKEVEAKREERENVLNALFGDSEIYPYHLQVWAKSIKDEQKYDSTLSATLRRISKNWQTLREASKRTA